MSAGSCALVFLAACSGGPEPESSVVPAATPESVRRWPADPGSTDARAGALRRVGIVRTIRVADLPPGAEELRLWIPAPANHGAVQRVLAARLQAPRGAVVEERATMDLRNRYWYVTLQQPRGTIELSARMEIERREARNDDWRDAGAQPLSEAERSAYRRELGPQALVPVSGRIEGLAATVTGRERNPVAIARSAYDHVRTSLDYRTEGEGLGRGDTLWACDARYGDSSDFHSLFVSLCRTRGIPSRFVTGWVLPDARGSGVLEGPRTWAAFYVRGRGWIPVDAADGHLRPERALYSFGALTEHHVAVTTGRDLELLPRPSSGTVSLFLHTLAECDRAPLQVDERVTWEDL